MRAWGTGARDGRCPEALQAVKQEDAQNILVQTSKEWHQLETRAQFIDHGHVESKRACSVHIIACQTAHVLQLADTLNLATRPCALWVAKRPKVPRYRRARQTIADIAQQAGELIPIAQCHDRLE